MFILIKKKLLANVSPVIKTEQELKKQENNNDKNLQKINKINDTSEINNMSSNSINSFCFIDSNISKSLIGAVNFAYSSVEKKLTTSQRETASVIKEAFENLVSGEAVTLRGNFLVNVSLGLFRMVSQMSEEQLKELSENKQMRAKVLIQHNKNIDKMINAKSISDFSKEELDYIEKNYRIKIVQENNDLVFYYTDNQGNQKKITRDDLKQLKIDLNNIIESPDLFNFSIKTGKSYAQFIEEENNSNNFEVNEKDHENYINKAEDKKENIKNNNNSVENNIKKEEIKEIKVSNKYKDLDSKIVEEAFFKKVLDKEEQEKKYHFKKLNEITETRRNIEKELNEKRLNEKYSKYDKK
ncbi:MAG: hypothetical protein KatS3mg068_0565 [Candidatus Sericytochromatia bacterium]|nr:MAG: hypothetical protein KatS3mg068_0565 [Candidatus Sericytochromatia bacterium]